MATGSAEDVAAEGSLPPETELTPRETRGTALNATLIVVAQSTQAIAVGAIALFLPLIRADLGLTFSEAGLLAAVATLSYALMQVPAGILSDRMSPKLLFGVGLLGTNALAIVFALSDSYSVMLVTQGVAGVFRALMFIPGMLLITRHFAETKRATAMGLFVAGGFSSNIVVNLLGPVLVEPLGWQWIIALSSIVGLVVAAAFWLLGDDGPPRDHGDTSRAATGWVWRTRAWWLLGVIQFSRLSIVAGVGFWVPTFLIEERGFDLAAAGVVIALSAALTAPSNIGGGILSDRLGRPLLVIGAALGSLTVLLALIGVVTLSPVLVALILVTALVIQVYFGPLFAVPRTLFGPGVAGLSSGFGNFCANAGGFVSVLLLGVLKDATGGFGVGFLLLSVLALIGFFAVLLLTKSTPRAIPG